MENKAQSLGASALLQKFEGDWPGRGEQLPLLLLEWALPLSSVPYPANSLVSLTHPRSILASVDILPASLRLYTKRNNFSVFLFSIEELRPPYNDLADSVA